MLSISTFVAGPGLGNSTGGVSEATKMFIELTSSLGTYYNAGYSIWLHNADAGFIVILGPIIV